MAVPLFHIVTTMREVRGNENHALYLRDLLSAAGAKAQLWSDCETPYARQAGATIIQAFSGRFPRGGTLILLGVWSQLDPWISHVRPERTILICNTSDAMPLYALLARLAQAGLGDVELAYVSARLMATMQLPGYVCPLLFDLDRFHPPTGDRKKAEGPILGRHSRDVPEKHHAEDPSLYKMLAWRNWSIRLMGATCLQSQMQGCPNTQLLPVGAEDSADFLRSLDVFFYRTHPGMNEAAGRIVLEAMACALPVVAHAGGGYTDWIRHGENGLLFETQEEAWLLLRRLEREPELRIRLGQAARESAWELAGPNARQAYLNWLLRQYGD